MVQKDISKKQDVLSVLQKNRIEHAPEIGDIYYSCSSYEYIRLVGHNTNSQSWKVQEYDFVSNEWRDSYNRSDSNLKEYYVLCVQPWEELLSLASSVLSGKTIEELVPDFHLTAEQDSNSTQLAKYKGKEVVLSEFEKLEYLSDKILFVQNTVKSIAESKRKELRRITDSMNGVISSLQLKVKNAQRLISVLEIYSGCGETIVKVVEGKQNAPVDIPVSIRQKILFMDEEMMVDACEGGVDYTDKYRFYEWLKVVENRNTILPEEKCVVVMKPRRFEKKYSSDFYENRIMNQWNFHSFVLIRNGENLYSIESDNLCVYDSVMPRSADMERLLQECSSSRFSEEQLLDIKYRTALFAMFVQGLSERTDIFEYQKIDVFKVEGVTFVYDDELTLGSGIEEWPAFLKCINKEIKRGDRIVFISNGQSGEFYRSYNEFSRPYLPQSGIYNIEMCDRGQSFLYLPGDTVFSQVESDFVERKNRVRFLPYTNHIINYEKLSVEIIEKYLKDRTQRKHYCSMIPLLMSVKYELTRELEEERHFVELMVKDIKMSHFGLNVVSEDTMRSSIREAIVWWKNKVIMKRPLRSDDKKAWKMIKVRAVSSYTDNL